MPDLHHPFGMPDAPALTPTAASRSTALRNLLKSPTLSFLMEAHSGLSAKIVEEAGFQGIWASGLSLSAAMGLRDNNEASWTQVLDQVEYMADATTLPILLDGDTGYGNFNNVRRLVRKLTERNIAGVCIEDKLFPKANSFIGESQPLADTQEFCGRIRAGKDAQLVDSFCIVARTEALISGHPMDEALRRAEAYHQAGADAVLIHSKRSTAAQILEFMHNWADRCPVVIVPTMYYATPTEAFRTAGVSTIIWANHLVRASISAMRHTARQIHTDQNLHDVEGRVASVADIFALTNNNELEAAQKHYLPATTLPAPQPAPPAAIILAAGRGTGALRHETNDLPPCMADIRGQPLIRRLTDTLRASGIHAITAVRGWRKELVTFPHILTVDNDAHATTGEATSLAAAAQSLHGDTVIVYGDVLFRRYILDGLLATAGDIVLAADETIRPHANPRDLIQADHPPSRLHLDEPPPATLLAMAAPNAPPNGEWIGLMRVTPQGATWLREALSTLQSAGTLDTADLPHLIAHIATTHPIAIHWINGHWLDVDTIADLAAARNFS